MDVSGVVDSPTTAKIVAGTVKVAETIPAIPATKIIAGAVNVAGTIRPPSAVEIIPGSMPPSGNTKGGDKYQDSYRNYSPKTNLHPEPPVNSEHSIQ